MTRRDQLAIKRAPPSARSGKGRRGRKPASASATPKSKASPKAKAKVKAKAKSRSTKKHQVSQHDVEDEEVSEAHPVEEEEHVTKPKGGKSKAESSKAFKAPKVSKASKKKTAPEAEEANKEQETAQPKKRKAKKNNGDAEVDTAVPKKARKSRKAACPSVTSSKHNHVGDSRVHMVNFIKKVDLGLELDGFKENVRMVCGDMGKATLNSYWTRFTCGLRWRTGRDVKDIAFFSFLSKRIPGSKDLKRLVAISCAVELVTC